MTQTDDAPLYRFRYWILLALSLLLYVAFLGVRAEEPQMRVEEPTDDGVEFPPSEKPGDDR